VSELAQLGTYAGNDAIVAFARLYQVISCLFLLIKTKFDDCLIKIIGNCCYPPTKFSSMANQRLGNS